IVVVGVFVGLQVSNWNAAQDFKERERELLRELRSEIEKSIAATEDKLTMYKEVGAAGERSLAFLKYGGGCGSDCWRVIVDFMHASQWQGARLNSSTYAEMRRLGLPRSRRVAGAVEAYHAQNETIAATIDEIPEYRNLVRGLVPVDIQRKYWTNCWKMIDGRETLFRDCEADAPPDEAAAVVSVIAAYPRVAESLTQRTGFILATPQPLGDQNRAGMRAIEAINKELGEVQ
ncbi:MAG: hypothetical protein WD076_03035, partial [Parvularculaceae bacterium]